MMGFPCPEDYEPRGDSCEPMNWMTPFSSLREDTLVEAVEGFRAWKVFPQESLVLHSFYMDACVWTPGQKLTATCHSKGGCTYDGSCAAGIYALKALDITDHIISDPSEPTIVGKVWLWGRILDCEKGYRAEFAYPSAFYNSRVASAAVASLYGVPLLPNVLPPPAPLEDFCY